MAQKKWSADVAEVLSSFAFNLTDSITSSHDDTKQLLWEEADKKGLGIGKVMPGLRLAMAGANIGPDLMGIIKIFGAEETSNRINRAVKNLN
jgi:glutamyl-tRNA synthetase